jgi:NifU-like protein involved in Fe-S cluster formation
MFGELYHNRVLELAAHIAHVGLLPDAEATIHKVSRVCGSEVTVSLRLDATGSHIDAIGVVVQACALGQASASVLTANAVGAAVSEVEAARNALRAMLKEGGPPPQGRFYELRHLAGVRDYPARHASTLLAFDAAVEAIDTALMARFAST